MGRRVGDREGLVGFILVMYLRFLYLFGFKLGFGGLVRSRDFGFKDEKGRLA